jgi:TolA-binding protein
VEAFALRTCAGLLAGAVFLCLTAWGEPEDQAQIDFANGLYQRSFYKEAAEEYKVYLEKFPDGQHAKTAQYRLGEAAYAAKDYPAALEAFDKVLAGNPDPATQQLASLSKGEVLYFLKQPADSALLLEPLAKAETPPEIRARALYYLGKVNADNNNTDAAVKAFKTLIEALPDSPFVPFAHYQLAFALLARNEFESAAVEFSAVAASKADADLRLEARFRAAETYDKIGWFGAAVGAYEQLQKEFPESPYAQRAEYGYAWALYHAGKFADAMAAGDALLKKHPEAPEAVGMQYLAGNCLQQQQRYDDAIAIYTKIRSEHPDSEFAARSQYKLAWCLYLNNRLDEAKTEIAAFLQTPPPDPKLLGDGSFLLGSILVANNDYENAYEEFRLVAEKYPDGEFGPEALYKAAECLAMLGRTEEAAKAFENFAKRYPDNILAEQAILRAGDAQFAASAFEGAVGKYKKILEAPKDASVEQDTMYRLAITYHNMKKYDASADTFRKLVAKFADSPHVAEAHLRIGDFLLRDGKDPVKAIEAYNASLAADPKGSLAGRALKGIALARYETKDLDAATETFLRLMTEFPTVTLNEDTYAWVGQRLFDQQKWEPAAVAFNAMLKAKSDYPNPERVRLKVAECSENAGKAGDAIRLYKTVVEKDAGTTAAVEAKYRMAKLYEAQNEADQATQLYEEAANTNTGDVAARARFRLGELSEAKGEFDAAARSYMRVAILFLHEELSPESLWRAGQCFEKAGSNEQAKKSYEELIKDHANSGQAAKAKEALAKLGAAAPK